MEKDILYLFCVQYLKEKELYEQFTDTKSFPELASAMVSKIDQSRTKALGVLYERMQKQNIQITSIFEETYPAALKTIHHAPPILFYKGKYEKTDANAIGVVGARNITLKGRQLAENFVAELNGLPITIISGMALGVDTIAHHAALKNGLRTIAVLGSGLDVIYPSSNRAIFDRITENGVVYSEFPLGTRPFPYNFPKRNRIISGLSKAVLIVEAGAKSGSLITARFATQQNKEVFSFPRTPLEKNSEGNNNLIKLGAKIATTAGDIINDVFPDLKNEKRKSPSKPVSEDERKILKFLTDDPTHFDRLCFLLDIGPASLANFLLIMEMKELIKELPGKYYVSNQEL